jgi:hypothetical protein
MANFRIVNKPTGTMIGTTVLTSTKAITVLPELGPVE